MKIRTLEIALKDGYSVVATIYDSEDVIGRKAVLILFKRLTALEKVNSRSIIDSITKIAGVTFKVSWSYNDQNYGADFKESIEL